MAPYAELLAQIELGKRLDYVCAWHTEHHFLRGYSHSSKPERLLAAARTLTIWLGHGIIPLPLQQPVNFAECVATLDVLSGGRLAIGIRRGFSSRECAVCGADMAASRDITDEDLDILLPSFKRQPLTHHVRVCTWMRAKSCRTWCSAAVDCGSQPKPMTDRRARVGRAGGAVQAVVHVETRNRALPCGVALSRRLSRGHAPLRALTCL